ncbi:TonB-dependent receptor [Phenylobacterium sp.]|uniref:TonB-dependent receptor n=1 Tax=Phenylobacterium sp. TaxID=1871053 RepID=UPI002C3A3069|nr:TonB-dependent receptor [Phenylobacterium sp.]HVI33617.1 TonB-dependent receptor [Phenylobacterium sp.]
MVQPLQVRNGGTRVGMLATASCAALLAALGPAAAIAQTNDEASPGTIGEVVVTASRRSESVEKLPFNVTAMGSEQLQRANVTDVASLTRQVPNFTIQDSGARTSASSIPIIRGLNASVASVGGARYFQSPVGFYLGNAPMTGSHPLFDIERVEVLRGPQGTLYGAGALSGTLRVIPVAPKLEVSRGFLTAAATEVAHSSDYGYSAGGAVNVPIGSTAALRLGVDYRRDAGFIDVHDVFVRQNDDYVRGAPILANPGDVANSRGVYFDDKDSNYAKTTTGRAAFLWKPTDAFSATLSYNYTFAEGVGGNFDNNTFGGGASPIDPRVQLRPTGDFERSSPTLEPWSRRSDLASLDASYDLGFATLATTLTYGKTKGKVAQDNTVVLLGSVVGYYYTGAPANPRAVIPTLTPDTTTSYTQEVRLVSASGGAFDYVVGGFMQQEKRYLGLFVFDPGADTQSQAAGGGSTLPLVAGGTYIPLNPDGTSYAQNTRQKFRDYSLYGDLTWHVSDAWQVTAGARVFHQTFSQKIDGLSSFFFFGFDAANKTESDDQIFKLNTSYQLDSRNQVYATWSQGFRRGGANAFQTEGPLQEPDVLLAYAPDKTSNFEAGVKGRIGGIFYAADAFYVSWDKPQIDLYTPYLLTPVVINAEEASSKGFEVEASGPIGDTGFSFSLGLAYAKARLTEDFSLPAGDGLGGEVPGALHGSKGDRLPGAPDWSGAANIRYEQDLGEVGQLTYSLGMDFRSSTVNQLSSFSANAPTRKTDGYALFNGSVSLEHGDWRAEIFGTNLANERVEYSSNFRTLTSYSLLGDWGNILPVARPREIGVRVTRSW